jgi:hypothetical protein
VAEITFLFLLNEMRQHPQLMEAFENHWDDELTYVHVVELDVGLHDDASIQTFLQLIGRTRAALGHMQDPIPGEFLRELAKNRGAFQDLAFGTIARSKIIEALTDLEQLIGLDQKI